MSLTCLLSGGNGRRMRKSDRCLSRLVPLQMLDSRGPSIQATEHSSQLTLCLGTLALTAHFDLYLTRSPERDPGLISQILFSC